MTISTVLGLRVLDIRGTRITDDGLHHMEQLGRLRMLDLRSTGITDAGLETIARVAGLRQGEHEDHGKRYQPQIMLTGSRVTEAGVTTLRTRLPGAVIDFD